MILHSFPLNHAIRNSHTQTVTALFLLALSTFYFNARLLNIKIWEPERLIPSLNSENIYIK